MIIYFIERVLLPSIIMLTSTMIIWPLPPGVACQPQLVFDEEFNGTQLNTNNWNVGYPSGKGELEYYASNSYRVAKGSVTFKAEKNYMDGKPFTSGMLTTEGKFAWEYGRFEIRVWVPQGRGLFPAFWLKPADGKWPPELDVFEILGQDPHKVYMTTHYLNSSHQLSEAQGSFSGPYFAGGYHTFALDWTPDRLTWYVDGVERFSTTKGIPHQPMYMLVNLAVGGDWPGPPDKSTPFPSYMSVDYIRVYSMAYPVCSIFSPKY